jgi:hypothetical protein
MMMNYDCGNDDDDDDDLNDHFTNNLYNAFSKGEFFLRYNNLQFDDSNEGNDRSTRIASCALFLIVSSDALLHCIDVYISLCSLK